MLSSSKYVIPMFNILPLFLAHFLNHAQHRRRDIVYTDSRRGKYIYLLSKIKVLIHSHSSTLSTHCFSLP